MALALSFTLIAQPTVSLEFVAAGFSSPIDIVSAGDARLFIAQQGGRIRIIDGNGALTSKTFLDISDRVSQAGGEQGLLGLVFDPLYAQNGFFYVNYINGSGNGTTRISRFNVTGDADSAAKSSEVILFSVAQPYDNHNGGDLALGPDGFLYIGLGDGGSGGDPQNRAHDMTLPFGKMLRIDVHSGNPYAIPPTNPYATDPVKMHEIWASGLRNPWRFCFDVANGDLWIGDVGQNLWEEVDRWSANTNTGPDFGWRCYEGNASYDLSIGCLPPANYVFPIAAHNHSDGSCAITGGRVYRGARFPQLVGRYLYTDYCHGRILSLRPNGMGGWINDTLMLAGSSGLVAFGEDQNNELYVANTNTGKIYRIIDPSVNVKVDPKIFLDGPFNSTTLVMADSLRMQNRIPLAQPYTSLGLPQVAGGGAEATTTTVLATTGNNAIVDWVRVELRSSSSPSTIVATRQALVQRDGDIVNANGTSPLNFGVPAGNYYVAVRHRNHLGVMTSTAIALNNTTAATVDFRVATTAAYGTNARKTVGTKRTLWAGNCARDTQVKYTGSGNDRDAILVAIGGTTPNSTTTGYRAEDMNLDGTVKYTGAANDRDPILVNVGSTIPTNIITEQLP